MSSAEEDELSDELSYLGERLVSVLVLRSLNGLRDSFQRPHGRVLIRFS